MRRGYNYRISRKTNESRRGEQLIRMPGRMATLIGMLILSVTILLFGSIRAFASSHANEEFHKYYTSIQVQKGDTLWDIADQYVIDGIMSREDFIEEARKLNGLSSDAQIHSGEYIVIAYYSSEYMP